MNGDELKVVQAMAAKGGVRWWHRIRERRGDYINGFINHDPDFMVMTERGTRVLVEVKGPHLDGSDSQAKAELGRADGRRLPEHAGEAVEAADAARDLR